MEGVANSLREWCCRLPPPPPFPLQLSACVSRTSAVTQATSDFFHVFFSFLLQERGRALGTPLDRREGERAEEDERSAV
jgi:hypothetical protein